MRRAGAVVAAIAAVALAALIYLTNMTTPNDQATADALPPDPAGRRAALRAALASEGVTGAQADILIGQAILETGNFKAPEFALALTPWNRHVGSGRYGDWNGHVCMKADSGAWTVYPDDAAALAVDPTTAREHLRCFDSLEQSVRDIKGLLLLSMYARAKKAFDAGDAAAYALGIAYGNGKEGFVGPAGTPKANNYTAGLMSQYKALGVA